ncbi:MAG: carbon-nitrogen hydrolase [Nitrospinota bacterium]|nr:MAG: carbon-nitrogen hydrolase [Nitrospinota bacterium]
MGITIGLAQINPCLGDVEKNWELYRTYIAEAKARDVQLLLFPELGLTGYFLKDMVPEVALRLDAPLIQALREESRSLSLLVGLVEESPDHFFYNAAIYFEQGEIRHVHRKVYLPTYGMFDEQRYFARGRKVRAFDTRFGRCGILICEDLWHPALAYILAEEGIDLLLAPSNSPGRGVQLPEPKLAITDTWELINRFYAKMFSLYLCYIHRVGYEEGVNFWGGSHVVNPEGEILAQADYFQPELLTVELDPYEVRRSRIYSGMRRDEDLDLTLRELQRIYRQRYFAP